jgi:hypothetical protein
MVDVPREDKIESVKEPTEGETESGKDDGGGEGNAASGG